MLRHRSRRTGFTLPEVLVTVAIVAILAAIVVPTVTNQISKGDDSSLSTNISSFRTGITAFVSDVRKFPGVLQDLLYRPVATDNDIVGGAYGAGAVNRWRGPYMSGSLKDSVAFPADSAFMGLAYAVDDLIDTAFTPPNRGYVGITLGGVTSNAAALHIDSLIDGGTGPLAGNLQWVGAPPTNNRLTLLLMGR